MGVWAGELIGRQAQTCGVSTGQVGRVCPWLTHGPCMVARAWRATGRARCVGTAMHVRAWCSCKVRPGRGVSLVSCCWRVGMAMQVVAVANIGDELGVSRWPRAAAVG